MPIEFHITGGHAHLRRIAETTLDWSYKRLSITSNVSRTVTLTIEKLPDCHGECLPKKYSNDYNIRISSDQSIRDFVGTVIHEMIHVRQYIEGVWTHDGERECGELEMFLTDELWKSGLI